MATCTIKSLLGKPLLVEYAGRSQRFETTPDELVVLDRRFERASSHP